MRSDSGQGPVSHHRQADYMSDPSAYMSDPSAVFLVHAAIARLVGDDPLAPIILAAVASEHPESFAANAALALVVESPQEVLSRARHYAAGRRDRQHLAVVEVFLSGDTARAHLLSREHLAEFPDDLIVSWITTRM